MEWLDKWQEVMRQVDADPKLQAEWEQRHDVERKRNQEDGGVRNVTLFFQHFGS